MSHEFIQTRLNAGTTDGNYTTYECSINMEKNKVRSDSHALVIPVPDEGTHYNKMLVECCVNILQQCCQSLSKSIDYNKVSADEVNAAMKGIKPETSVFYGKRVTEHGLDIEMTHRIREVSDTLQWMVNSTSWREGKFISFDKCEIARRLRRVADMIQADGGGE